MPDQTAIAETPRDPAAAAAVLYFGEVMHARLKPMGHRFSYRVMSLLIDLRQLEAADRQSPLFGVNRAALYSFNESDHGERDGSPLRDYVQRRAAERGIDLTGGRVLLLCYPRLLGFTFNPLSVYFCYRADGALALMIYEVRNTFGEHHFYEAVVAAEGDVPITHELAKAFYVSPFNTVDGTYRFAIRSPAETVFTGITLSDAEGGLLTAYFEGERHALTDAALLKVAIGFPLMTLKVIAGIHWEAVKLWLKGVPLTLRSRPKASTSLPIERRI